ncbi:hypothetical protein BV898_12853 [Hypsibius exemplaris]|uniref:LRAT domain-containing protein n=1 Tax=Hypsibius exemplaris TaxID=2072580 RepID=A0A1W0WCN9_HYPEX|nr:hypothetical protein BV898_12853 [Hypsibius exemplaris]
MGCFLNNLAGHNAQLTDECYLDGRHNEVGEVQVYSKSAKALAGLAVHHGVVVTVGPNDYRVFEVGPGKEFYKTAALQSVYPCLALGRHALKDVYQAAQRAWDEQAYCKHLNNCNHFCERIAASLDRTIEIWWSCACNAETTLILNGVGLFVFGPAFVPLRVGWWLLEKIYSVMRNTLMVCTS